SWPIMQTLTSINPANNSVVGTVTASPLSEIIEKVQAAHRAKAAWKMLGAHDRCCRLQPLQALISLHQDDIARLITQEMGKPISQAQSEIQWAQDYLQDFLDNGPGYLANEITVQESLAQHEIVYEPFGVAACITPWNYPFSNFIVNVIPLLITGNVVVFKHSEECPLVGQFADQMMQALTLPDGVYAQVYGDGAVGQQLVEQDIQLISFTGSSQAGHRLAAMAGQKCIKAVLEMGGSDPAVLFDDAPIDTIIPELYARRFMNCGQICCAVKRLIVQASIYDRVVDKLVDYLREIKIGDPMDPDTQMGPLAALRQLQLLEKQVAASVSKGAKIAIGGKKPDNTAGAYYLPTVLTHIDRSMSVWREEIFGPVLPVIAFRTEEEAIALANDTPYGLSAVVYSTNLERARRVAAQIDAGCIDINLASHWRPCNPFGGYKASGMGRIYGKPGFLDLCQIKVIAQ
ncbi:MAG TPA: aldehyde dehydrogenase family protein, partial [Gammaproteobacteria bacterium]|nr:aldehyde dehydrogenase family protein [Gammaproteobacteria bacterium]